jgi:Tol biopolymer transport system component
MRKLLLLSLLALLGLLASGGPAPASPPEANGRIVFSRAVCSTDCVWDIVAADPSGANETVLAGPYPRDAFDDHFIANWSPDGQSVIFMANQGIWQVNADGTGLHELFTAPSDTGVDDGPSFTPDGTQIIFTRCCPEGYGYSLWSINSDGTGLEDVTKEPAENGDGPADTTPQLSPEGRRVLFNRCFADRPCAVATANLNGTHLREITPDWMFVSRSGNWSPQGNEILFSGRVSLDVHSSLWVIHADGSGLRQIQVQGLACGGANDDPTGIACLAPRWSPDGRKIIFVANSPATGSNIYTVNADGSRLTQVTFDGGSDSPGWGTHPLGTG